MVMIKITELAPHILLMPPNVIDHPKTPEASMLAAISRQHITPSKALD
jgi:hypothetical protein